MQLNNNLGLYINKVFFENQVSFNTLYYILCDRYYFLIMLPSCGIDIFNTVIFFNFKYVKFNFIIPNFVFELKIYV